MKNHISGLKLVKHRYGLLTGLFVILATVLFLQLPGSASTHSVGQKSVKAKAQHKAEKVFTFPNLPSIKGGFGQSPTISFPAANPPTGLVSKILIQGNGPKVPKGSLLIANYIGQIWHGKVFDSSFSRHVASSFPIGIGQVIPGWDKTLVGLKVGTRIMLVIPPKYGYGPKGQPSAGITGKDTLVFVVDIIGFDANGVHATGKVKYLKDVVNDVKVTGPVSKAPSLTFLKGNKAPKSLSITLLDRGTGAKIKPGLVVMEYVAAPWGTKQRQSSWIKGQLPLGSNVAIPGQTNEFGPLVGIPLGSRVLLQTPKTSSGPSFAVVLDLVSEPKGAYYS